MSRMIKILSVNVSEKKGVVKLPVDAIRLTGKGISGDVHSGHWHRQVSMLGVHSIQKTEKELDRKITPGEFAENITTEGMPVHKAGVFDRFYNEQVELEVTQIGKKCHGNGCAVLQDTGRCVMPEEGVFLRVLKGGRLRAGDHLTYRPRVFEIKIITISDRASRGIYEDRSGPEIARFIEEFYGFRQRKASIHNVVIPDDPPTIRETVKKGLDQSVDIIITTGGTGIGPRDFTPDVVRPMLAKEIPGIMELVRVKYGMDKPNALLSRGIAGVTGMTQLYTLPGSVKAVKEYCEEIFKTIDHTMLMLHDIGDH